MSGSITELFENRAVRVVDMRSATKDAHTFLRRRRESGPGLCGLSMGFTVLDELLSGLQPGYLYVVAGRPSMGRTTFALNIVQHLALGGGKNAAFFSLHDSATSLMLRLFASVGRIEINRLRTGDLTDDEWARLREATLRLTGTNGIFLADSAVLSVVDLCETARRLKEHQDISILVVDSLESIRIEDNGPNGPAKPGERARSLKAVAEELNIPVIAVANVSRSVDQRGDHRPTMADLNEPEAIDDYADVVFFVYRDAFYNPGTEEPGATEVIVARNRDGDCFAVKLAFRDDYLRFGEFPR